MRAKTGTLNGKSCLSGLVGDGSDVLAFSILVEGIRGRHLAEVRGAQVGCVNAMMRYVYEAAEGPKPIEVARAGATTDLETGGASEGEEEVATAAAAAGHRDAGARGSDRLVPAQAARQRRARGARRYRAPPPAADGQDPAARHLVGAAARG